MSNKDKILAIRTVMLPKDTNYLGSIFGGVILSHIDLAAAQHASIKASKHKFVTKVVKEVNFISPVYVGDALSLYTSTLRIGQTSIAVEVEVFAEDIRNNNKRLVTNAQVVMVAVDGLGRPVKLEVS